MLTRMKKRAWRRCESRGDRRGRPRLGFEKARSTSSTPMNFFTLKGLRFDLGEETSWRNMARGAAAGPAKKSADLSRGYARAQIGSRLSAGHSSGAPTNKMDGWKLLFNYFTEIEEYFWKETRGASAGVAAGLGDHGGVGRRLGVPLESGTEKGSTRPFESYQRVATRSRQSR